ncbi:hypothetical protein BDW42DRAFT_169742 [Aspergillus taichungensis]|uniref:Uncharacterized protein n=1 Tax=Aspergillus taichungensis TaxID=482145 RepID=A0A2J5HUF6_9EURO|nr:hypothetical protein BDW42DRAFT_169742 [Aspergillus taichungensis]
MVKRSGVFFQGVEEPAVSTDGAGGRDPRDSDHRAVTAASGVSRPRAPAAGRTGATPPVGRGVVGTVGGRKAGLGCAGGSAFGDGCGVGLDSEAGGAGGGNGFPAAALVDDLGRGCDGGACGVWGGFKDHCWKLDCAGDGGTGGVATDGLCFTGGWGGIAAGATDAGMRGCGCAGVPVGGRGATPAGTVIAAVGGCDADGAGRGAAAAAWSGAP